MIPPIALGFFNVCVSSQMYTIHSSHFHTPLLYAELCIWAPNRYHMKAAVFHIFPSRSLLSCFDQCLRLWVAAASDNIPVTKYSRVGYCRKDKNGFFSKYIAAHFFQSGFSHDNKQPCSVVSSVRYSQKIIWCPQFSYWAVCLMYIFCWWEITGRVVSSSGVVALRFGKL